MTRILIIDDERSIRHILKEILEHKKYYAEETENGRIGLEKRIKKNIN